MRPQGERNMQQQNTAFIKNVKFSKPHKNLTNYNRIVDVRDLNEWNLVNIPGAHQITFANLIDTITQLAPDTYEPILVYCAAGERSATAAQLLVNHGYQDVTVIQGGIEAWIRAKLPTTAVAAL